MKRSAFLLVTALSFGAAATQAHAQMPNMPGMSGNGSASAQVGSGQAGASAGVQGSGTGGAGGLLGGITGGGAGGGLLGGALGGAGLPGVGSASSGNIAGVLNYCVAQNAVSATQGNSVLSSLTGQGNVASSAGYQNGLQGALETGGSNSFTLANLSRPLKQRLCRAVLNRAKSLI